MTATRRTFLAALGGLAATRVVSSRAREARPEFGAKVYLRTDAGYELQRQSMVRQAVKPARFPELIVPATNETDVVECLKYARKNNLTVAVRGSGHNYVASFLHDGGMLVDVSRLRGIDIDADKRRVATGPGIRGEELLAALGAHGLAFPVAHDASVTMGGYLLGGGMGWNGEHWGRLACYNVRAVDVISAAGERLTVNANTHPELYWAARGAGPGFCAVATRFHLDAFALPRAIHASTYVHRLSELEKVLEWADASAARHDPKVEFTLIFATGASGENGAEPDKVCIVSAVSFADRDEDAMEVLGELAAGAPAAGMLERREFTPITLPEVLAAARTAVPRRVAVDTVWTPDPRRSLLELSAHFDRAPSRHNVVIANFRANVKPLDDAAYSVMAPLFINLFAGWDRAEEDAVNEAWMDEARHLLLPFTAACYINETDFIRHPDRARRSFSAASWERLERVRKRYDPQGMFHRPF